MGHMAAEARPFGRLKQLVPEILLLIKPKNNSFPPKIAVGNLTPGLSDLLHSRNSSVFCQSWGCQRHLSPSFCTMRLAAQTRAGMGTPRAGPYDEPVAQVCRQMCLVP